MKCELIKKKYPELKDVDIARVLDSISYLADLLHSNRKTGLLSSVTTMLGSRALSREDGKTCEVDKMFGQVQIEAEGSCYDTIGNKKIGNE